MNGRIYDAKLGRFLQADPFIQAASNTQSYNRYSYVLNNPLNATDPSGFFFKSLWDKVRPFVGAIVAIVATYVCSGNVSCGQAAWAWIGAASGAAGAAANGGNILTGAITGVISGAVFYGIGTQFTGAAEGGFGHIMAHAAAGGVLSVLQGGKFGHGFISAGLTKAANISRIMANDAGGFADAVRTTIAAIVGGTISKITGGKFANGATTAALAQALNGNAAIQRRVDEYGFVKGEDPFAVAFSDLDEAGYAALTAANGTSIEQNKEYGGLIYRLKGKYYHTDPIPGNGDTVTSDQLIEVYDSLPKGALAVGEYHTHGDYSKVSRLTGRPIRVSNPLDDQYNSDNFSDSDMLRYTQIYNGITSSNPGIKGLNWTGFLATPGQGYKIYDAALGRER